MPTEPVPLPIRNAPTKLMKDLGYGKGYEYARDTQDKPLKHFQNIIWLTDIQTSLLNLMNK